MRVGDYPTPEEPTAAERALATGTAAVIDSEILLLQVMAKIEEEYPVPPVLKETVESIVRLAVDKTLEVMTDLGVGKRVP